MHVTRTERHHRHEKGFWRYWATRGIARARWGKRGTHPSNPIKGPHIRI